MSCKPTKKKTINCDIQLTKKTKKQIDAGVCLCDGEADTFISDDIGYDCETSKFESSCKSTKKKTKKKK